MKREFATLGVLALAACGGDDKSEGPELGTVEFGVTAVNAGPNARLVHPLGPPGTVAPHTIDPSTYPVQQLVSGPPDEMILTLKKIEAVGPMGPQLLFGTTDGSGPGVDIHLTNGAVDLEGVTLNAIPTGHYTRANIWVSRSVKMKGCIEGLFMAQSAVVGSYEGQSYTTDTLAAGTHRFCTIASRSLVNVPMLMLNSPIGTDAEYEAQLTPELTEFDVGGSTSPAGIVPTTPQAVRDGFATLQFTTDFDVVADTSTKVTLVVDLNRMLRFWPNAGFAPFHPPDQQGHPVGTSYFFVTNFNQNLAIFAGEPGSIEGYQIISETCEDVNGSCVPGSPPDALAKEWMTLVRYPDGTIAAGVIQADDMHGAIFGDVVPSGVVETAGTFTIPIGSYRDNDIRTNGTIDGFIFKSLGDPEDSCTVTPIQNQGPATGHGPFPFWYTRRL